MGQSCPRVPKKSRFTVVENENKELVQTRLSMKIRVCIDYKKLNAATRKDHFSLRFIDQMLERLAGHECYCFLDDYSGYNQIPIALEDQEKLLSHVHLGHLLIVKCLSACAMPQQRFNVACWVFSLIWWNKFWKYSWLISPLWRLIRSMLSPSRTHSLTLCRKNLTPN